MGRWSIKGDPCAEIKFRGRRLDNGEWAKGYYVGYSAAMGYIYKGYEWWEVDPKTVGQYTGLKETLGAREEIYKGDILVVYIPSFGGDDQQCPTIFAVSDFIRDTAYLDGIISAIDENEGEARDYVRRVGNVHDDLQLAKAVKTK